VGEEASQSANGVGAGGTGPLLHNGFASPHAQIIYDVDIAETSMVRAYQIEARVIEMLPAHAGERLNCSGNWVRLFDRPSDDIFLLVRVTMESAKAICKRCTSGI